MSKTKRKRTSARLQGSPSAERGSLLFRLLTVAVGALLVGRLLVPTESAAQGATLWLTQLWLAAGLLWLWDCVRERDFHVRLDGCDLALWVIVGSQVVSALRIVVTEGQKRAAINMLWEWVGLAVAFFLVRQVVRTRAGVQRVLLVMVVTAVSLSGLGLWQHYVFYPQAAAQYQRQREELSRLRSSSSGNDFQKESERLSRIRELEHEFVRQEIPEEGPARVLWEERLRSSTEPFGLFALANSFAGLLVVWLIVALAVIKGKRQKEKGKSEEEEGTHRGTFSFFLFPFALTLLAFCLLLTKSRTAWIGLCAGLCLWSWLGVTAQGKRKKEKGKSEEKEREGEGNKRSTSRVLLVTFSFLLLTFSLFLAVFSGGVDREVLSEAPKSFRYRLQYWTGTVDVIRESPWFGVGPGNFRQHYLKHKLPESSEEIADPHNCVLDLWTSGGLPAVIGLAAMIAMAVRLFRRSRAVSGSGAPERHKGTKAQRHEDEEGQRRKGTEAQSKGSKTSTFSFFLFPFSLSSGPLVLGAGLSFWLVFGFEMLLGNGIDYRLPALFVGWVVLLMCLGRAFTAVDISSDCLAAAAAALLVHLLGAGGIAMPAIAQTLLLLLALASLLAQPCGAEPGMRESPRWLFVIGCAMPALFIACLLTATGPVLNRRALVASGDFAWLKQGNSRRAATFYLKAVEHDPFSPEPANRLAEVSFRRWKTSAAPSEADFQDVVGLSEIAIAKDPFSANGYWTLGQRFLEKFSRTQDPQDAAAAEKRLAEAAERYPNHAAFHAEWADALDKAGRKQRAREEAKRSLDLDAVNRNEGHRDKYLPPQTVEMLDRILGNGPDRAAQPNLN